MDVPLQVAASPQLPAYLLFTVSDLLAFTAIYIPYTHLPPLARAHGLAPSHAALLISAGGVTNTGGRLLGGWVCDRAGWAPLLISLTR